MHILSPETDNCPSWISGRERMTVENISWSISTKECCRPRRGLNPRPPGLQSDGASNWATEAGCAGYFKSHCCKQCGPRSDCSFRSSLIWIHTVCLYAKCKFEKFARRCSRRHKQTTFSDADFLRTLRVNWKHNYSEKNKEKETQSYRQREHKFTIW